MGVDGQEALQLVVCKLWGNILMESTNRIMVVQLDTNEDETKVFRAHAVPQGL